MELFFDTFEGTRKVENLRRDPRIALVIGGQQAGDERTLQYEGVVDRPEGDELKELQDEYFRFHPDGQGRSQLPDITYFRVRPRWIRLTDFNTYPARILQYDGQVLLADFESDPRRNAAMPVPDSKRAWQPTVQTPGLLHGFGPPGDVG